jgi:hypothetical protein
VAAIYITNSTSTSTSTTSNGWITYAGGGGGGTGSITSYVEAQLAGRRKAILGQAFSIDLPDGGLFELKADGSYTLLDKDAKITYRAARHRDFNKYLNCSDLIEEFINYVGNIGLKKNEIMKIPVSLFIAFLVVRAAEADGEEVPEQEVMMLKNAHNDILLLPAPDKKPHCELCGRFISPRFKSANLLYCNPEHAGRAYAKRLQKI